MRQIFGDRFNDFLRQIGSEHSAEIQSVAKRRNLDTSIDAKYLEAVEEFLAEKASLGVESGTTWQKICAAFRQFLRNMGLNIAYSDNDIQQLFRQSLRAVQGNGQITDGNGDIRYAKRNFPENVRIQEVKNLTTFENNFLNLLKDFDNDTLQKDKVFELGSTPDALTMLGVPQLPVAMSGSILYKAKEKHNLSIEELKQIPYSLYNPVMIFDSSDQSTNFKNGMVVLTQIKDRNKKPVIIALNIEKTSAFHKINDIASIYGKNNVNHIIDWINEGFLRYSHKNRALAFARFHRLQLPKKATISERSNNTIIDESPDVKSENEKNQENIRKSIAPVIESNKQWRDPDSDPRMIELEQQKAEALKDTLNAVMDNGQRFDEWDDEWADLSEDERIEHITGSYDDTMSELYQEIEEEQQFSRVDAESLISQAYDATVQYAEQLGYTVKANDVSRKSLSTYITVNNGSEDFKIRISDHWNINRSGVEHFGNNDVDVIVQNDKIDLSDVWQFLEQNAPDNGNVRFSVAPQVDTPAFKNWFKDSKVVDENGNPLVVYHGTDRYK